MELRDQLQSTLGDAYRIERELAAGGMARVFVAHETTLGRRVVVKTLSPELAGAVSAERFRREIRLAASLQQANIVPVHSAGEMDGVPYYTMPYVEGESLRSHLTARGALPVRVAIGILRDVARALAFAHERGVVHRDIKPENVLLSGSTAVVTDFGIAKALEVSATHPQGATLTQLGTALGTPAYMSPEQATGDPNVDHRADIYALGVLAYELLAGAPPFSGRSLQALVAAHVVERPPDLTSRAPSVPRELAALVMRCLEKDPARRPQSAREVLDTLEGPMTNGASAQPGRALAAGIAVLPFANLSPDAGDEYFADGLTDEIITDLSAIRALRVIARGAMMRFKATTKEPVAIARELGVRYVLDGSVRRGGSSLRMTVRLIDAADGSTLWTDKLGGAVEDVFAMQERVSHTIVEALQLKLSPREEQQIRARPMSDLRAYECFLQARQALWTFTPASLNRAERLLEEAQSLIGNEPRLLAGLAGVHLNYADTGQGDTVQHTEAAARYVSELVKASPTSFERYLLEGWLQFRRGEIREAIASLTLARELEPNNPDVLTVLCYTFILAGRDEDALQVANMAISIDPLTPLLRCMPGFCAMAAGRTNEAVAPYREFADLDPSNPAAHFFVAWSLLETGQREECGRVADRLFREFPSTPFGKLGGAIARGLRGDTQAGLALLTPDVRPLSRHSEMFARALAAILTTLGDHEAAIDALADDVRLGFAHYPFLAHRPTALAPLRSHPRFRALLEVVRQRWERGGASAEDYVRGEPSASRVSAPSGQKSLAPKRSIAVLPFANLSSDPENEYFSDGITEDIISHLSKIGRLKVISRTSTMRYKGTTKAMGEIAAELGAEAILEGSVRRAGNRVRVVAQLIDAAGDEHLWAETYDRELTDVFAIQSDVALQVAAALRAVLTPGEKERVERKPTENVEAYNWYLLGRYALNKRTSESLRRAAECFEKAVAADPGFAMAYAGLADTYTLAAIGYGAAPRDMLPRAKQAALDALRLDESLADAHTSLGYVHVNYDWDFFAAERELRRAIELNPSSAQAHQWWAHALADAGLFEEALVEFRRALDLDPLSVVLTAERAWPYLYTRDFDTAMTHTRRALAMDPDFALAHNNLGVEYDETGRPAEALAEHLEAARLSGGASFMAAFAARTHVRLGQLVEARRILDDLTARANHGEVVNVFVAFVHDSLGEPDQALRWLELAYEAREPMLAFLHLNAYLVFENLGHDARFHALLDQVGMAEQARRVRERRGGGLSG